MVTDKSHTRRNNVADTTESATPETTGIESRRMSSGDSPDQRTTP